MEETTRPVYKQIAIDIAMSIVGGKYQVGQKISGRSTLASKYNVSPETIRRAVALLEKMEVLSIKQGKGIYVISYEQAEDFINKLGDIEHLNGIKTSIVGLIKQQQELNTQLEDHINILLDANDRFNYLNPLTPFEVIVTEKSPIVGKSISDLHFWNKTGATIIALKRNRQIMLSPGPYAILQAKDTILIVGNEQAFKLAKELVCGSILINEDDEE